MCVCVEGTIKHSCFQAVSKTNLIDQNDVTVLLMKQETQLRCSHHSIKHDFISFGLFELSFHFQHHQLERGGGGLSKVFLLNT